VVLPTRFNYALCKRHVFGRFRFVTVFRDFNTSSIEVRQSEAEREFVINLLKSAELSCEVLCAFVLVRPLVVLVWSCLHLVVRTAFVHHVHRPEQSQRHVPLHTRSQLVHTTCDCDNAVKHGLIAPIGDQLL
jgi:hypothetical protein